MPSGFMVHGGNGACLSPRNLWSVHCLVQCVLFGPVLGELLLCQPVHVADGFAVSGGLLLSRRSAGASSVPRGDVLHVGRINSDIVSRRARVSLYRSINVFGMFGQARPVQLVLVFSLSDGDGLLCRQGSPRHGR